MRSPPAFIVRRSAAVTAMAISLSEARSPPCGGSPAWVQILHPVLGSAPMYHAVVLCGGSGTRLWPLTRQALPKQFLPLTSDRPLLVETVERLKRSAPLERIWLIGGRAHERLMREQLPE